MGNTRKRFLPQGWYPDSKSQIEKMISSWDIGSFGGNAIAGMVPHAGWEFCGDKIAQAVQSLPVDIDTIVVLGGHNPKGGAFISYNYDYWLTPMGTHAAELELINYVESTFKEDWIGENIADNTIEVVLVMAMAIRPDAKWAAWRVPADSRAMEFGKCLADCSKKIGKKIAVIGSTDLTHYGPRYHFAPPESQSDPQGWVEERDRKLLDALIDFKGMDSLELAAKMMTACSIGGAVATMNFARCMGASKGRLLSYGTSRDVYYDSSFVGYGSLIWE